MGGGATRGNPALEAAIVGAPDDPVPRMVYGDWFQQQGDPIGEWVAIQTAVEARPDDVPLKSAAIAYQADHQKQLFERAAGPLAHAYIGWKYGFCDELRLHEDPRWTLPMLVELFANPLVRFVRHISLGPLKVPAPKVIDAIVEAKLPLLEEMVVGDGAPKTDVTIDAIAQLPLKKLALHRAFLPNR